jgi:hypothetical protein
MEGIPNNTELVPILVLRDSRTKMVIRTFSDLDEVLEYLSNISKIQTKNAKKDS